MAERLRERGHRIVFAVDASYRGKLVGFGFEEEIIEFSVTKKSSDIESDPQESQSLIESRVQVLLRSGILSAKSSREKLEILSGDGFLSRIVDKVIANEPILKDIIARVRPDLYILDHLVGPPSLIFSDKPWVFILSANPLSGIHDTRTPPNFSGYAASGDQSLWPEFRERADNAFAHHNQYYNRWLKANGYPTIDNNLCIPESPHLNLYGFPEELDYTDIRPNPKNWFRMDSFMRSDDHQELKLPDGFHLKGQKLIYLSLGSMASVDVQLMSRLVAILAKSPHKYIVSKGVLGHQYSLADNMWGEKCVPQTRVLPIVDLVITHGGNNTIYEAFSFGKPMIIMPLFADQFNNAQRVHEKGFGLRLDPYNCSAEELLNSIDKLLNDTDLKHRLSVASKRIQNSDCFQKACELIENLKSVDSEMAKKLTILFAPVVGVGHVNACIGLAEVLLSRGHKIVFVIENSFAGKLSPFGFIEEVFASEEENMGKPGESEAKSLLETGLLSNVTSYKSAEIMMTFPVFEMLIDRMRANEPQLKAIVAKHNPDVYIIDDFAGSPTLIHSNKPWVFLFSGNPLFVIHDDKTPPGSSGYPSNGDPNKWQEFKELFKNIFKNQSMKYNEWMKEEAISDSPYLNIYGYPEELDYLDLRPLPKKWLRVDAFMRKNEKEVFKIPDKFCDRDIEKSKLLYLSLGSMGSVNVDLMKRLVSILSKSQHKFIVSKRVLGDTYELADNMWGENSVPQTKVLPLVDVVITHGGNNSVTESFSFGKPMIIMPLFADQYDNAQRVMEKGFGIRLNPH
ncbi:unnamed protein product, partial [Medioppia subpectinata]